MTFADYMRKSIIIVQNKDANRVKVYEKDNGEIEIEVDELKVLGESKTPPFEIVENSNAKEDLRLKYRYLDLRRADLQKNILMRHKIAKVTRDYFDEAIA